MGKGHRDNHKARLNRGETAFDKKAKRRNKKTGNCNLCGREFNIKKIISGLCPVCMPK